MKKVLLLLLCIITFNIVHSQEKQTDSLSISQISEAERIIDKYSNRAVEGFKDVVEGITPAIKDGFEIAVKLQIAKGFVYTLPLPLVLLFFYLFTKEYFRINNLLTSDSVPNNMNSRCGPFDEDNLTPLLIIYIVALSVFTILSLVTVYDGITHLIAPEWFAIKEIIELFK